MEILADVHIDKELKCTKVPLRVRENKTFLMNTTQFKDWEDIKSDMNGTYPHILRTGTWTVEIQQDGSLNVPVCKVITKKKQEIQGNGQYHLKFNSKKNHAGLCRSIVLLLDKNSEIVNNTCLLQYHIATGEDNVEFEVQSHGSSSQSKPFFPCDQSLLKTMKERVTKEPSRTVYEGIRKQAGGPSKAENIANLPRSKQQVYHLSHRQKTSTDPVDELLKYAKETDENVVLSHHDFPEDLWILGTSQMCKDLDRFCTSELMSHPCSVDPTFSFGKYEVTPFCYRHLFLKSKRTQVPPIFIGPTALHHSKSKQIYKKIVDEVTSATKGFAQNAKGFITDGEVALHESLKDGLVNARGLRCFAHFQRNCSEKLNSIGIKQKKEQSFFIDSVFGKKGKEEGILDAWGKRELRARLDSIKDGLNTKERELLQKDGGYQSQFWQYLDKNFDVMAKNMIAKARSKAHVPMDNQGKPERCYTHQSESLNNILTRRKELFIKNDKGKQDLSKLQFVTEVFQPTFAHQLEELTAALYGGSDEYELAESCKYLELTPETWYGEFTERQREEYVNKFNELTVDNVMQQKTIRVNSNQISSEQIHQEFQEVPSIVEKELEEKRGYSLELTRSIIEEVRRLINSPHAIQRQPSLVDNDKSVKFFVATRNTKGGYYTCTKNDTYVTCACNSYKHDSVCKHSISIAIKEQIIQSHLQRLKPRDRASRAGLVQPNSSSAGKKGSRNKNPWRVARSGKSKDQHTSTQAPAEFNPAIHHNDKPFVVCFLEEAPKAKECRKCRTGFIRRTKIIPFDIVLSHEERWMYPDPNDRTKWLPSATTTVKYYCVRKSCVMDRFPYFNSSFLEVPALVKEKLLVSHFNILQEELAYNAM